MDEEAGSSNLAPTFARSTSTVDAIDSATHALAGALDTEQITTTRETAGLIGNESECTWVHVPRSDVPDFVALFDQLRAGSP